MGRICADVCGVVTAGQMLGGKKEMEINQQQSKSFGEVWWADGKHELQRLLKRSVWGLCLQRDLTRLAGLKMQRSTKISCLEVQWVAHSDPEYRRGSQRFNKAWARLVRQHPCKPFGRFWKGLRGQRVVESGKGGGCDPYWRELHLGTMSCQPRASRAAGEEGAVRTRWICAAGTDLLMKWLYGEQRCKNVTLLSCKWDIGYWFLLMAGEVHGFLGENRWISPVF